MSLQELRNRYLQENYDTHAWYKNRFGYPYPYCKECGLHALDAELIICLKEYVVITWKEWDEDFNSLF